MTGFLTLLKGEGREFKLMFKKCCKFVKVSWYKITKTSKYDFLRVEEGLKGNQEELKIVVLDQ